MSNLMQFKAWLSDLGFKEVEKIDYDGLKLKRVPARYHRQFTVVKSEDGRKTRLTVGMGSNVFIFNAKGKLTGMV